MEHAARLRDRTAEMLPLLEACEYDSKEAYPYVPCCYEWLGQALRELEESYESILREADQITLTYTEVYGEPMTEEQKAEFIDYWVYSVHSLESMVNPIARMLADFDCLR